ncbi:MAG TPA: hypothetical protein VMJ65_22325 [Solirubrobacteraceae bacterium]|nr:hypothetical protein [Solirubrobacteraceae bacterium]
MSDRFTRQAGDPEKHRPPRVAMLAAALLTLATMAPAASAKTVTLHIFSRQTSSTFVDAQGHPVPPNMPPVVGDTFDNTGVDYAGNHKHHAAKPNGSDHLRCTITGMTTTGPTALCSGQIAIGGSMLLANDETLTLSDTATPTPINGGTGIYRHARGLLTPTNIGNNTDFTIKVMY